MGQQLRINDEKAGGGKEGSTSLVERPRHAVETTDGGVRHGVEGSGGEVERPLGTASATVGDRDADGFTLVYDVCGSSGFVLCAEDQDLQFAVTFLLQMGLSLGLAPS